MNFEVKVIATVVIVIIIVTVNGLIMYFQSKKNEEEEKEISATNNNTYENEDEEENRLYPNYNCKVIDITNMTSGDIESELKTFLNKNDIDIYGEHGKMFLNDKNIILVWDKEEEW